ncbi:MAG: A/G-specific adenine glycosylase [Proteobacteria bacterium]|nr:A/G-specific adenine glycosylase [Pseudomonadota bacterium]
MSTTLPPSEAATSAFADQVVRWQRCSGRHQLPWQNTSDAYRIWVSEVMLQQTQVRTVLGYYEGFLARFPDVFALANANLDEVLSAWSGLGYYRRARNLHACARYIVEVYKGEFPCDEKLLAALPGIGRSSAAAIAAFAFNRRAAILDGNVKRVLARVFALSLDTQSSKAIRTLWSLAEGLLPVSEDMPAYTQGLMDLGATLCLVRKPRCGDCPVQSMCLAYKQGHPNAYPLAKVAKSLPLRQWMMLWITDGDKLLLLRRPQQGIWASMWSLPALEDLPQVWLDQQAAIKAQFSQSEQRHKLACLMQTRWRQDCGKLIPALAIDGKACTTALAVLKASTEASLQADYWLDVEQSFTHFRLRAPVLRMGIASQNLDLDDDKRACEPPAAYEKHRAQESELQSLWIKLEDALELGIPSALRKLLKTALASS